MSDKTPHWPGADGKPGVSFAPKSSATDKKNEVAATEQTAQTPAVKADDTQKGKSEQPKTAAPLTKQGTPAKPAQQKTSAAKQSTIQTAEVQGKPQATSQPQAKPTQSKPAQSTAVTQAVAKPTQAAAAAATSGAQAAKPAPAPLWATKPAKPSAAQPEAAKAEGADTTTKVGGARRTRKARLRVSRIDPWSVMKTAFLFSIAFGIMLVIMVAVLWSVIQGSGALDAINSTMTQLIGDSGTQFNVEDYINSGRVIGFAAVLAAVDVVIITAVATLFAFLYNLAASVMGGLEVTLAED